MKPLTAEQMQCLVEFHSNSNSNTNLRAEQASQFASNRILASLTKLRLLAKSGERLQCNLGQCRKPVYRLTVEGDLLAHELWFAGMTRFKTNELRAFVRREKHKLDTKRRKLNV